MECNKFVILMYILCLSYTSETMCADISRIRSNLAPFFLTLRSIFGTESLCCKYSYRIPLMRIWEGETFHDPTSQGSEWGSSVIRIALPRRSISYLPFVYPLRQTLSSFPSYFYESVYRLRTVEPQRMRDWSQLVNRSEVAIRERTQWVKKRVSNEI